MTCQSGRGIFPARLHQILTECEASGNQHIISFMPCGKYFKVHDQKGFADKIMPKYFRHSRFKSFLRQLSMYKFARCSKGPCRGAYGHPHFIRGRTDLCRLITRSEKTLIEDSSGSFISTPKKTPPAFDDSPYPLDIIKDSKDFRIDFDVGCLSIKIPHSSVCLSTFSGTPQDILDEIINTFSVPQTSF
ncbi:HSF-type DNA-binding protein [Nitzschia inconspicua]|uniref:HSF-type DNA-binding protein n=1 Tax=Nitzschia inconspicua TaxID=303405 RepID=A0A9K3LSJ7_9STRA|nr:HSF-type DNA-binding protein [Nitzschia inconspicua]